MREREKVYFHNFIMLQIGKTAPTKPNRGGKMSPTSSCISKMGKYTFKIEDFFTNSSISLQLNIESIQVCRTTYTNYKSFNSTST